MNNRNMYERLRNAAAEIIDREPTYLTAPPAPTVGDYPLRKRQEDRLYRALSRRGSTIMLYGPGGMGKTHMARSLFYRLSRKYRRLAWVEYGNDLRTALTPTSLGDVTENPDIRFARFVKELRENPQDTILFIDDAKECAADDPALAQITGMGITIFLTSRCPEIVPYEGWELEPVTDSECVGLFYANYQEDPGRQYRKTVEKLVQSLDRNIFALLLLARVARKKENLTHIAKALEKGTLMDHIGQLMRLSGLTDCQMKILRCLSLMPSAEMPMGLVDWFSFPVEELNTLVEKGWLTSNEKEKRWILHDLVREYCNRKNPSQYILKTFIRGALGEDFNRGAAPNIPATSKEKILELQARAVFLKEKFGYSSENLAKAYKNMGIQFRRLGNYRISLTYLFKALSLREEACFEEYPDLASLYSNIGTTYENLGDREKALEYHLENLKICEKVLSADDPNLAASYSNVGTTYGALGNYEKALKYHLKDLDICEKVLLADDPDLATSYNNVGTTYGALGDHEKSLQYHLKDLNICEKVLPADHPDLATSYNNVGTTYGNLGDSEKALEYQMKALRIFKKVLPADHPDLATSYNNIGGTYHDKGDTEKALEYIRKALKIREKVLPADHPDIANSCFGMAKVYDRKEDYVTALKWTHRALDITQHTLLEDCSDRKAYQEFVTYLENR